ncbi:MAG: type II toxin-antitoxin system VapC family toxin [Treponema sp.]|nr:type II toxin-antitoxin system VapC family toxin [Treponema sp.]
MSYLVDTNVISELSKSRPDKNVSSWIINTPEQNLFLSVITIGEIIYGINKLTDKARKNRLTAWLDSVIYEGFENRILDLNLNTMRIWGEMYASVTRSLPVQDTLIAATAIAGNLTIATRNIKDFRDIPGLSVFNPWENE